ncbi:hypothetical protein MKX01_007273 [Papaver californicum]|nr:hypothetical protein MKX01_007273 [Papaver californicum]
MLLEVKAVLVLSWLLCNIVLAVRLSSTNYRSPEDGKTPDHRPTNACTRYAPASPQSKLYEFKKMVIFSVLFIRVVPYLLRYQHLLIKTYLLSFCISSTREVRSSDYNIFTSKLRY